MKKKKSKRNKIAYIMTLILSSIFILSNPKKVQAESTIDVWDGTIATSFAGGNGTYNSPYIISTAAQLAYLAQQVNAGSITAEETYIVLNKDIDLGGIDTLGNGIDSRKWTPIGTDGSHNLKGYFDGAGHTIKGLYINSTENYQGLFGWTKYAEIENLTVEGIVTGNQYIGGIAGFVGSVKNCISNVEVTGDYYVGGISGEGSSATNCCNMRKVTGRRTCGGIFGYGSSCLTCYNNAVIVGASNNPDVNPIQIGGITGYNQGMIKDCYNLAKPQFDAAEYIGGISGRNAPEASVSCCFYYGDTIYENSVKHIGIISNDGHKTNCYYKSASTTEVVDGQRGITTLDFTKTVSFNNWNDSWKDMVMGSLYPQLFLEDWMVTVHDASSATAKDAYISFNTSVGEILYEANGQKLYSTTINMNKIDSNSFSTYKNNSNEAVSLGAGDVVTITKNGRSLTYTIGVEGDAKITFDGISNGNLAKTYGDADFLKAATVTEGSGLVTYDSSVPAVATVSSDTGDVSIFSVGTTVITATTSGGSSASYTLTVYPKEIECELKVENRKYDPGNRTVSIKTGSITSGVLSGDEVSIDLSSAKAVVSSAYAGPNKKVTVSGMALSGKDAANYTLLPIENVMVDITKADKKDYPSDKTISVDNSVKTIKEVKLPSGWKWIASDESKELTEGVGITATAEYVGDDKDSYEVTTESLTITRSYKNTTTEAKLGDTITDKSTKASYTITSVAKTLTVTYNNATASKSTTINVPDTVKIGDKTYKVTEIKANAFKNNKKLKKITIGKNIKKIGKNAFYGCKNLKNVTIKTTLLTKKTVGKNAFKGINAKAKVKVPKKKLKAYKTILKKAGIKGKKQKITK